MSVEAAGGKREKDREQCDLLKHFNELCRGIDQDIRSHRQEHERVRAALEELHERGQVRGAGVDSLAAAAEPAHQLAEPAYKRVSDEVIRNQQNQIELIKEEKDTFEKLWKSSQRTVRILELEIHEYRRQLKQPKGILDLRQQYTAAAQLFEQNLSDVRQALGEKLDENRHLQRERTEALERTAALETSADAQRQEAEALARAVEQLRKDEGQLRSVLERTMRDKTELEELLDAANALAKQHMGREQVALAKVQEALLLADSAIEEKHCVVRRERDARAECDFLASTIGQVMEEAARKVEHELAGLRGGYEGRIGEAERALELTRSTLEAQSQRAARAETRARTVEDKFRALLKTNQNLDTDLRAASKMIVEMELKMEALQKTMAKEKETNRACSAREEEDLQRLLANNEQLKGRWKREMLSVTGELQRKIETMHRENCQLRAENNQLKDQLLMVSGSVRSFAAERPMEGVADVDVAVTDPARDGGGEATQHGNSRKG